MVVRTLADGNITVWQENDGIVIHHAAGLTIALTEEETEALFEWMSEIADGNLERMTEQDQGIRIPPGHSVSSALRSKLRSKLS